MASAPCLLREHDVLEKALWRKNSHNTNTKVTFNIDGSEEKCGVPMVYAPTAVWYNTDMWKAAGLTDADYTGIMSIGWNADKYGDINSLDDLMDPMPYCEAISLRPANRTSKPSSRSASTSHMNK